MEDFLVFASITNFILIIVMTIVFFIMARNVSKITRRITNDISNLTLKAKFAEYMGDNEKAIELCQNIKFLILEHKYDYVDLQEHKKKIADIDARIESLQTKL